MRDLHNSLKVSKAFGPQAIVTGNAANAGAIIDTQGFESLEFAIVAGTITDGTFTPTLTEGNDPALADGAAVAASDTFGVPAGMNAAASNTTQKVGYKGSKRYVRLSLPQTGATTGGFIAATAIQGHGRNAANGPTPAL